MIAEHHIRRFSGAKLAPEISRWFNEYACQYQINTPLRTAAFLAQVIHESGNFRHTKEIWGPSPQQLKYERDFTKPYPTTIKGNRNYLSTMLGNSFKGDGAWFRGHGYIQITGRTNHAACSKALFGDKEILIQNPELLCIPQNAMRSAFWFWSTRNLNTYADKQWVETITKRINGGLHGFSQRIVNYNKLANDFGIPEYKIS